MYEKLLEIFKMVDFLMDEQNYEDIDTITIYQGTIPNKLNEIKTELLTMFE